MTLPHKEPDRAFRFRFEDDDYGMCGLNPCSVTRYLSSCCFTGPFPSVWTLMRGATINWTWMHNHRDCLLLAICYIHLYSSLWFCTINTSQEPIQGAPMWFSRLSVPFLVLTQTMISWVLGSSPGWALHSAGSLLEILSLCPPPHLHSLSLFLSNT